MVSERSVYAGLDVGSSTCHLVALDARGSTIHDEKFGTSEANLIRVAESLPRRGQVHLESSELSGWVGRVLRPKVVKVVVSHARTLAWIAKDPLKRDQLDAFKLAELLRLGRVHEVYQPGEEHRAVFKQIVQHYDDVSKDQARLKVKIKSRLRAQGVILKTRWAYHEPHRQRWLPQVKRAAAREAIEQLCDLLDHAVQTKKKAMKLMVQEAQRYPEIPRFRQVPGVGPVAACVFSAYIQTPHRFSNCRKLWRYCGLGISDRSSDGKPLGRKSLDHSCNRRLKDISRKMFIGAMRCRESNLFQRYYRQSVERTHEQTHARLSTQRKLLAVLRAIWISGEAYDDHRA